MPFRHFSWRRTRTAMADTSVAASTLGPPAVQLARAYAATRNDIEIEPLETEFMVDGETVAVRAWVRLSTKGIPADKAALLRRTAARLAPLPPAARRVFFLCASYGLPIAETAREMALPHRKVRALLLAAIARLDDHRS